MANLIPLDEFAKILGTTPEEVRRMQETEVQAFQTALILRRSAGLNRYLIYLRNVTRGLRWRLSDSYRQLRALNGHSR
jgi:hypothetical protein